MITDINNEDRLVQQTFAEHLKKSLGWESIYAYNAETFGQNGTFVACPSGMWCCCAICARQWRGSTRTCRPRHASRRSRSSHASISRGRSCSTTASSTASSARMGDVAKYVKLYREALAPIPCARVVPQFCLVDSLSPESDGPCLLRRGRASSVSGESGSFLDIT